MSEESVHQTYETASRDDPEFSGSAGSDQFAANNDPDELAMLVADRDKLAAENADLQDRILRNQAEFQNYRKREEQKRLEMAEYASTEAVRALLPILDDFERALKVEGASKEYAKGMELIYQRLYDSLKKLGLEPIISTGQPFDPHIHHAVEMVETGNVADHTILDEYQRGYNFKGRMLRPAMVKVAVAPASGKAEAN